MTDVRGLVSSLTQNGNGLQAELDPASIDTFEFPIAEDARFELWIDELVLLKKPAGGACP